LKLIFNLSMLHLAYQLYLRRIQLIRFLDERIIIAFYILMIYYFSSYICVKILLLLRHVSAYLLSKRDSHNLCTCFIKFIFFRFVIHLTETSNTCVILFFNLNWLYKALFFLKFLHLSLDFIFLLLIGVHLIKFFTINYIFLIIIMTVFVIFIIFIFNSLFF